MRRFAASALVLAMSLTGAPVFAAGPTKAQQNMYLNLGTINGEAQNAQGQILPNYTVRARNLSNGALAGSTTSNAAGQFSFVGLNPGNYAIEIVDAAGKIVGTSASIGVTAGATVSVTVTASAAAALGGALGAAAGGAAGVGGGLSTALIVVTAAGAAGIVGLVIAVNRSNASSSR